MKILELRFKNLNSLYGEWRIDFTVPEYAAGGIFALTGPTGAGKSTILDAICLALYGATPRLSRITKSGNEIMSRQTGDCYAEVLFESQAGTFRCHWSQHRARRRADGKLAEARHEIAEAESGRILETRKREVASLIEEKTGMDFERFTRSILLAQGGFDTFLRADVEQKSKILEQITGTEIYTEISRRVHERQRQEQERFNVLHAEMQGIVLLDEEQEKNLQRELLALRQAEDELAREADRLGQAISWHKGIGFLQHDLDTLNKEAGELDLALEEFLPVRGRLEAACKAALLDGDFATLVSMRRQRDSDLAAAAMDEAQLPQLEAEVVRQAEVLGLAEQKSIRAREERMAQTPLLGRVRSLDQRSEDRGRAAALGRAQTREAAEQIVALEETLARKREALAQAQRQENVVRLYLQENAGDEQLVAQFAGIEEQLHALQGLQRDTAAKEAALRAAEQRLAAAEKAVGHSQELLAASAGAVAEGRRQLELQRQALATLLNGRLLREYRAEKEAMLREMAYRRKIADLQEERKRLTDGKPCPLCGALQHPFADGNVPEADEAERHIAALTQVIDQAEELESRIVQLEAEDKRRAEKHAAGERRSAEAVIDRKNALTGRGDVEAECTRIRDRLARHQQAVLNRLQAFGVGQVDAGGVEALLRLLRERLQGWQEKTRQREEMRRHRELLDGKLQRLEAVLAVHRQTLADRKAALHGLEKEYGELLGERRQLFGERLPDEVERQLEEAVTVAEQHEKMLRQDWQAANQRLQAARVRLVSLRERLAAALPQLQQAEAAFVLALQEAGLGDEGQFLASRLSSAERQSLQERAATLDGARADLKARLRDRKARLAEEMLKKPGDAPLEELQKVQQQLAEKLGQTREHAAGLGYRLNTNLAARAAIRDKQDLVEAQKRECGRWDRLHLLIGSADGKKYRNFAQGLTFELMVSHANRQLARMTDRYLLIRDEEQPLELNVIDNYQAGEIRSTRNLSGGESFVVSLSLALGLSKMASRKVRVDSLFLDEGFGSLDEEALETALDTLASLRHDGKLIGVISHVPALRERIGTQIVIRPLSGGRSLVEGPGCTEVKAAAGDGRHHRAVDGLLFN